MLYALHKDAGVRKARGGELSVTRPPSKSDKKSSDKKTLDKKKEHRLTRPHQGPSKREGSPKLEFDVSDRAEYAVLGRPKKTSKANRASMASPVETVFPQPEAANTKANHTWHRSSCFFDACQINPPPESLLQVEDTKERVDALGEIYDEACKAKLQTGQLVRILVDPQLERKEEQVNALLVDGSRVRAAAEVSIAAPPAPAAPQGLKDEPEEDEAPLPSKRPKSARESKSSAPSKATASPTPSRAATPEPAPNKETTLPLRPASNQPMQKAYNDGSVTRIPENFEKSAM